MNFAESALNDNLIYSSPRIHDRRRRILDETRNLIALHGSDGFGIRELCHRAKVAPQTVYKAFENKERLIALAIRHHFQNYADHQHFHHAGTTLPGVIERLIASDVSMRDMREYVAAIVSIYFSQTAQSDIRVAASYNSELTLKPWVYAMREQGHLRKGIQPEMLLDRIVGLLFTVSLGWCRGNIDDDSYIFRKIEAVLICAAGATRGAGHKEISTYLTDILGRRTIFEGINRLVARPQTAAATHVASMSGK